MNLSTPRLEPIMQLTVQVAQPLEAERHNTLESIRAPALHPVMPKRILIINPNTTAAVTDRVIAACQAAHPSVQWDGATGNLGASYISSEVAYALGAHAALEAYATSYQDHDAVLLACFGDPGLLALRELASVPVVGLAQSSFEAAARAGRFAVVTGGKAWEPMLLRFARMHGLDGHLAGVFTDELTGAQIAADPARALTSLAQACALGVTAGAQCILLGGAGLTGLASQLQAMTTVPVLDNVLLAAQAAVDLAAQSGGRAQHPRASLPLTGVNQALVDLLK